MRMIDKFIVFCFVILIISGSAFSGENRIDLALLSGHWDGQGNYILPFTGISTTVNAVGVFNYDSTSGILHTRFDAERFMIKYSDSGRMSYLPNSDSLKWDNWNSFGYFVRYKGKSEGQKIHGRQKMGRYTYDLYFEMITADSIDIKVTTTDNDGETSDRITGYLRRTVLDSELKP